MEKGLDLEKVKSQAEENFKQAKLEITEKVWGYIPSLMCVMCVIIA